MDEDEGIIRIEEKIRQALPQLAVMSDAEHALLRRIIRATAHWGATGYLRLPKGLSDAS